MPFIFSLVKNTASVLIGRFSRGQAPLMMWGWDEPRSEGGYMNLVIITLMMRNFNTDHSVNDMHDAFAGASNTNL